MFSLLITCSMKTLSTADWVLEKRFITTMLSSLQSFPRVIGQIETIVCLLVNLMVSCNCMEMNLECFYIVVIITTVTVLCAVVLLVFNDQTFSVYQYCRLLNLFLLSATIIFHGYC
jgi:hypothetical protein